MAEAATLTSARPNESSKEWMSYEEFLANDWPNPHVEWVDGEVIEMSPVGRVHQNEGSWLIRLLGDYLEIKQSGEIQYDPFQMKTAPDLPGRAPDIIYIAKENLHRLHETFLEGPADIVIEIVSPGSGGVDRGDKYLEYEAGGVKEYWLIDPVRRQVEFSRLGNDGCYHQVETASGIFKSEVLPEVWIKVEWLWPETRPTVLSVLREWGLLP